MKLKCCLILAALSVFSTAADAPPIPKPTQTEIILEQVRRVAIVCDSEDFYYVYSSILFYESGFKHNTINWNTDGSYDYGVAQLNSRTFDFSRPVRGYDIRTARGNARVGAQYFFSLVRLYKGDLHKAVMAYNCGMGNVARGTIPSVTYKYAEKVMKRALTLSTLSRD